MEDSHKDAGLAQRLSRRDFFKAIGLGSVTGALLLAGGRSLVTWMLPTALQRSTFAARVGESFNVSSGAGALTSVQLVNVRDLGVVASQAGSPSEQSFSLAFRGPQEHPLIQGTYDFGHRRMGGFQLFIVPMAVDGEGRYYEAVFNRM